MAEIRTTSEIDFRKLVNAQQRRLGQTMVEAARAVIVDDIDRIKRHVDLQDRAQKQNAGPTKRWKYTHLGHFRPLIGSPTPGIREFVAGKDTGYLSSFGKWRINGLPANTRTIRGRGGPRGPRVRISPPIEREDILVHLRRTGYRVPFGVARALEPRLRDMIGAAYDPRLGVQSVDMSSFLARQFGSRVGGLL